MNCPCHSHKPYKLCCEPYHKEIHSPQNALQLMRSRYSAYALGLTDYIVQTTAKKKTYALGNLSKWKEGIEEFHKTTEFVGLTIHDFEEQQNIASVTFTAHITQNEKDVSFTEKSAFIYEDSMWFYLEALS